MEMKESISRVTLAFIGVAVLFATGVLGAWFLYIPPLMSPWLKTIGVETIAFQVLILCLGTVIVGIGIWLTIKKIWRWLLYG